MKSVFIYNLYNAVKLGWIVLLFMNLCMHTYNRELYSSKW